MYIFAVGLIYNYVIDSVQIYYQQETTKECMKS